MKGREPETSAVWWGYLFAVGSTLIWSGNFIVARELKDTVPPVTLAFWRWFVAVAALSPFAFRSLLAEWRSIRENLLYLSVTSFLGVTVFNTLLYIGGHTTSALNLSLISITSPIFIIVLARLFLGEPLTLRKLAGIALVVAGVVTLITRGDLAKLSSLSFTHGDLWMLAGAIVFAVYSILIVRKPPLLGVMAFQLSTFMLGLLFLAPFYAWERWAGPPAVFDRAAIFSFIYLGIFASFFAFVLWHKAVLISGASRAGMIYYALPLFSGILAWVYLHEPVGLVHLLSGLLIISGIFTANFERKR